LDGTELLPSPSSPPITHIPAVIAMRDALLAQPPKTAWLVVTGTVTNAAVLFAAFPELISHIKGLSIMGGAIGDGYTPAPLGQVDAKVRIGNITPYAEFNIYCDPESARAIFTVPELAGKTWLVPLDVTHLALATPDVQRQFLHGSSEPERGDASEPSSLRRMFHDLLLFFAKTYDDVFGISAGPPLHDPLAVAILLDPEETHFDYRHDQHAGGERWVLDIVTSGEHAAAHDRGAATVGDETEVSMLGRTVLRSLELGSSQMDGKGTRVPRSVDLDWFWKEMLTAMDRADKHVESV
jgi:uridine nucleosidase